MITDPRVAMITFTGSVPVGEQIRAQMGLRRVTLELGSNSSVILEPDCDLDMLIPRCVTGSFTHSGQVCISVQNIYVHESIEKTFTSALLPPPRSSRSGHPLDETTDISSLISARRGGACGRVDQSRAFPRSASDHRREAAEHHD